MSRFRLVRMNSVRETPNSSSQSVEPEAYAQASEPANLDASNIFRDRFFGRIENIKKFVTEYENEYAMGLINLQTQQMQERFAIGWNKTKADIKAHLLEEREVWQGVAKSKGVAVNPPSPERSLAEESFSRDSVMKAYKEAKDAFVAMEKMSVSIDTVPAAEFLERANKEMSLQLPRMINCLEFLGEAVGKYATDAEKMLQQKAPQTKIERHKSESKVVARKVAELLGSSSKTHD